MDTVVATSWYKQFWPWFLIALPGSVVIASVITIIIANKYNDPVVIDDYYKAGLAINKTLDRKEFAKHHDIRANIYYAHTLLTVTVTANKTAVLDNTDALQLRFIHPTQRNQDITVLLKLAGTSNQQYKFIGQLNNIAASHWHIQLEPATNDQNNNWRLDDRLILTSAAQLDNYTLIAK